MSDVFTKAGLELIKSNGKVVQEALKANEKALDEGKWYLSGKNSEGKPRKRSQYVQYLRGKMDAYREMVDGTKLKAWAPEDRPKAEAPASVDLKALKALLKQAGLLD